MSIVNALLILSLLAISSGCATIIHGTTQDILITTDPSDADLLVDGSERYRSPTKITLKRKNDHMVEINKDGYQKENVNIKSVISGVVAGNIVAGGLIGIGVDALSGGACRLVPERVDIHLRPLTSQSSSTGAVTKESIEEKIDQLAKLKEKGKITEEEYKKMRQEILATSGKEKILAPPAQPPITQTILTEPPKPTLPKSEDKVAEEPSPILPF